MLTSVPKELAALKQLSLVYVALVWPWTRTPNMQICRRFCCVFIHVRWPCVCIFAGIWATTASARWHRSPSATWRNSPHCKLPSIGDALASVSPRFSFCRVTFWKQLLLFALLLKLCSFILTPQQRHSLFMEPFFFKELVSLQLFSSLPSFRLFEPVKHLSKIFFFPWKLRYLKLNSESGRKVCVCQSECLNLPAD